MATSRRNVLFVTIDQLRADCLFGTLGVGTPLATLRELAGESHSFLNHFTVTNPCGPARASLLTGRYAMNHRSVRNGTPLDATMPNLATEARRAGYEPLLFGYTDTSTDPRGRPEADPDLRSYEGVLPGFRELAEMRAEDSLSWRADLMAKGYALPQ